MELKTYSGLKLSKLFKMRVHYNYVTVYKSKLKGRLETLTITHAALSQMIQHLTKLMNYRKQHQLDSTTTFTFKLHFLYKVHALLNDLWYATLQPPKQS